MEVALVGNPNCGKTTLFNALTGSNQRVGNWAGVTVERKSGTFSLVDKTVEVVDLPGTFSLTVTEQGALDERIACDYLLLNKPRWVINVVDGAHLERSLYLSFQLLEMGVSLILAVNMLDVASKKGIHLDLPQLSQALGCPVIGIQANRGKGVENIKQALLQRAEPNHFVSNFDPTVTKAIDALAEDTSHYQRWLAMRLLEDDVLAMQLATDEQRAQKQTLQQALRCDLGEDPDILLADNRYQQISACLQNCLNRNARKQSFSALLDNIVLHRFLGVPIFLAVMYTMFLFAINVGTALQDFFEILSQTIFIDGLSHLLMQMHLPQWIVAIVAAGVGMGITTTLTFIPVIGGMFLFLSFLESSGYMARAAFVTDRLMRQLGLPGKSFVPLIVGFGCNVPSVMAARTLENYRDRILTIMMSPFMSCGARLAIYAVFVAAFFPVGGQNVIFLLYLIGVLMAVLTGLLLRKTLLGGEHSPLIMELPAYHLPTPAHLLRGTWHRLKSFVWRAGKVIVPLCIVIGFLNTFTWQGEFVSQEGHQNSLLSSVGKAVTPVFKPMGISEDNWPATVGLATGMVAKEVVVGTLNALYSQVGDVKADEAPQAFNFWQGVQDAWQSVPDNIAALKDSFKNPVAAVAPETDISKGMYGQMYMHFGSQAAAFAYLLFVLLYFPCVATTAAMLRELNVRWTVFSVCWTTGIAYLVAVIFYQMTTFLRHPMQSLSWLGALLLSVTALVVFLMQYPRLQQGRLEA